MLDNDLKYGDASLRVRENTVSKIKGDMNRGATDNSLRLLKLIDVIPNWETYLTDKQLQAARKYITCMSAYEVDHQLGLSFGTTQQRLFGNSSSKGALGRLEDVAKKLEETGYFEKLEKRREAMRNSKPASVQQVSEEIVQRAREFIRLVIEMPEYEQYLTKEETEKVVQFLTTRSFKKAAAKLGIPELTLRNDLLGKTDNDGILLKLRQASQQTTVNSWDEI